MKNNSPLISEPDLLVIKISLIMPIVQSIFELDIKTISGALKTPEPYLEVVNAAIDKSIKINSKIKREMFKRGLKVYEQSKNDVGINAKYKYRGYQGVMNLHWEIIKAESSMIMSDLLGGNIGKKNLLNTLKEVGVEVRWKNGSY